MGRGSAAQDVSAPLSSHPLAVPRPPGLPGRSRRPDCCLGAVGSLFGLSFCLVGVSLDASGWLWPYCQLAGMGRSEWRWKKKTQPKKNPNQKNTQTKSIPSAPWVGASGGSVGSGARPVLLSPLPGRQGPPASEGPCSGRDPLPEIGRSLGCLWKAQGERDAQAS